jgi:protein-tyrosine phosphatase
MLRGVIDLHSHVLPGLDDGPASLEESVELARAAAAAGVTCLAATPHVRDDYPTSPDAMERGLAEVRAAVAAADVDLELLPGGEIALGRLDRLTEDDLARFGLGGNPRCLLLEFPYRGWPLDLPDRVFRLVLGGFVPVLAHPERNDAVQARPERLADLVKAGALVQLTAASVDGRNGRRSREASRALLELGCAHLLASDAHLPSVRAVGFDAAVRALRSPPLARWLTVEVPQALVAGEPLPPRPDVSPRRRLLNRLR